MTRRAVLLSAAVWSAIGAGFSAMSCGGTTAETDKELREQSCAVPPPTACPEPAPGFDDVTPIFEEYCGTCHSSDDPEGPWPLEEYSDIVAWQADVRDEVLNCTMPPQDGEPLPPAERQLLMEWIYCGMPR